MLNPMPKTFVYDPPTEPWLTVLHADDDIVVLDKPSGLLTVPGRFGCCSRPSAWSTS